MIRGFRRLFRADALRLSKTPFFPIHLLVPVLGVLLMYAYVRLGGHSPTAFSQVFYQLLAMVFPILAAWTCSIASEQEIEAGGGFVLLSAPSRSRAMISKLIFLLVFSFGASILATMGYGLLVSLTETGSTRPMTDYFQAGLVLWGCSIFFFLFHFWLGLRLSRGVSFAFSALESLLSALMITGLGDTIWFFIPSGWGIRLVGLCTDGTLNSAQHLQQMQFGITVMAAGTVGMLLFFFLWAVRWEGRKSEE